MIILNWNSNYKTTINLLLLGSTDETSSLIPGPMLEETVALRMYFPFKPSGLASARASMKDRMFSNKASWLKLILPIPFQTEHKNTKRFQKNDGIHDIMHYGLRNCFGKKLQVRLSRPACTIPFFSTLNWTDPALAAFTARATSLVTVPIFGLGIMPRGPKIYTCTYACILFISTCVYIYMYVLYIM